MKKYRWISSAWGVSKGRFEYELGKEINSLENFSHEFIPSTAVYENCGQFAQIEHGSFHIVENTETKKFIIFDYGDHAQCSLKFEKFDNFVGAYLGQYNVEYLKSRNSINISKYYPGFYPENRWQEMNSLYEPYTAKNDNKLFFCGSLYGNDRHFIRILAEQAGKYVAVIQNRLPYKDYIKQYKTHGMALCCSAGFAGGDICLRDIEMFGLGIPVLRPTYEIQLHDQLIPNVHYIAVDVPHERTRNAITDHAAAAQAIIDRYAMVINDIDYLKYIVANAKDWYNKNLLGESLLPTLESIVRHHI